MKVLSPILSVGTFFLSTLCVNAQEEYVRGQDPAADAIRDMQSGMAGLKHATKDPQLMAQLMNDLQNPEMMAEAKKMMDSPEFKKQMKQLEKSKDFKEAQKKAKDMMADPQSAARMQAQMEHMVQRGNDSLQKNAAAGMTEAMKMMQDPSVMEETVKMMKDPNFLQQLSAMQNDPGFQNYMKAMQQMMQDPTKKEEMERLTNSMKAQL